ncbi:MAG TPA: hypothetical protein VGM88_12290 [Kofleriaceae bacterium]|jgi:hypothetical protein
MTTIRLGPWEGLYQELFAAASAGRGIARRRDRTHAWPRTTGRDVVAIGAVIGPLVRAVPGRVLGTVTDQRWRDAMADLATFALVGGQHEYAHNDRFWRALLEVCTGLASLDAELPDAPLCAALATRLRAPSGPRIDGGGPDPYVSFAAPTATEQWCEQRDFLCARRGVSLVALGEAELDGARHAFAVPRAHLADAEQLARYWHRAVTDAARATPDALAAFAPTLRDWIAAVEQLRTCDCAAPDLEYPHNAALWRAALAIAAMLTSLGAEPAPWTTTTAAQRNALGSDARLAHFDAKKYDDRWRQQRDYLAELRGADTLDPPKGMAGSSMKVPRALNSDILQLATLWTNALAGALKKSIPGDAQRTTDVKAKAWRETILPDVEKLAKNGDRDAVYPKNNEFFRTSLDLAIWIAVIDEAPSTWDVAFDAVKESALHIPDTLKTLAKKGEQAVEAAAKEFGKAFKEVGAGLFSGLGTPLLIGGAVVGGVWLLSRATKSDGAASRAGRAP